MEYTKILIHILIRSVGVIGKIVRTELAVELAGVKKSPSLRSLRWIPPFSYISYENEVET